MSIGIAQDNSKVMPCVIRAQVTRIAAVGSSVGSWGNYASLKSRQSHLTYFELQEAQSQSRPSTERYQLIQSAVVELIGSQPFGGPSDQGSRLHSGQAYYSCSIQAPFALSYILPYRPTSRLCSYIQAYDGLDSISPFYLGQSLFRGSLKPSRSLPSHGVYSTFQKSYIGLPRHAKLLLYTRLLCQGLIYLTFGTVF